MVIEHEFVQQVFIAACSSAATWGAIRADIINLKNSVAQFQMEVRELRAALINHIEKDRQK